MQIQPGRLYYEHLLQGGLASGSPRRRVSTVLNWQVNVGELELAGRSVAPTEGSLLPPELHTHHTLQSNVQYTR